MDALICGFGSYFPLNQFAFQCFTSSNQLQIARNLGKYGSPFHPIVRKTLRPPVYAMSHGTGGIVPADFTDQDVLCAVQRQSRIHSCFGWGCGTADLIIRVNPSSTQQTNGLTSRITTARVHDKKVIARNMKVGRMLVERWWKCKGLGEIWWVVSSGVFDAFILFLQTTVFDKMNWGHEEGEKDKPLNGRGSTGVAVPLIGEKMADGRGTAPVLRVPSNHVDGYGRQP
ncbi:hypothetical protein DFH07DRAFT_776809 [Mycena maculata]|uniref:Uncharacterized protein n=1 Tax=Mycena maculata TaxID=230809 RepID=A0AAD7ILX0_9AGAR|nr:hypothetical protein DFH07DRAFT_776809 [Mycena maculata]